jgi:hypothetical protein
LKKQLTLEQISPWWAKRVKKGKLILWVMGKPNARSLGNAEKCIVGEAHGWAEDYKCRDCRIIGDNLCSSVIYQQHVSGVTKPNDDFMLELKDFIKHWNKKKHVV